MRAVYTYSYALLNLEKEDIVDIIADVLNILFDNLLDCIVVNKCSEEFWNATHLCPVQCSSLCDHALCFTETVQQDTGPKFQYCNVIPGPVWDPLQIVGARPGSAPPGG